ncbi:MAG: AhpC/TSA family protein [Myxococcaceae bacterium]|nr:MAG: AhpC/TSA family protein [Myxococcaceae bacterium]
MRVGDQGPPIGLRSLRGAPVAVPRDSERLMHLQFRRFAGCPICNLHLRSVARRIDEITAAKIMEVAVFHSEAATMAPYQGDLPFEVVADPEKVLYRAYGVEASVRSLLHPRAWVAFARGVVASHPSGSMTGEGGHVGLPADFLLDGTGRVLALKYGEHADDQWSVDEILEHARDARSSG